jgi:hypothetical protein
MATPAYVPLDEQNPTTAQTRQAAMDTARTNDLAERDGIISGRLSGWTEGVTVGTGSAEEPQFRSWAKGIEVLRGTYTYSSGYVTNVTWQWSNDSGATFVNIGAAETRSYDGSGNTTAGANGSALSWLYEWIGKIKVLRAAFLSHVNGLGAAVHGLGSMAVQMANAVAIAGGSASLTYSREKVRAIGNLNAASAVSWIAQGVVTLTVTGSGASITHGDLPAGGDGGPAGTLVFRVVNGGLATELFPGAKRPGGVGLGLSASGIDYVTCICVDGATVEIAGVAKDIR